MNKRKWRESWIFYVFSIKIQIFFCLPFSSPGFTFLFPSLFSFLFCFVFSLEKYSGVLFPSLLGSGCTLRIYYSCSMFWLLEELKIYSLYPMEVREKETDKKNTFLLDLFGAGSNNLSCGASILPPQYSLLRTTFT